jgi:hypothetical protein
MTWLIEPLIVVVLLLVLLLAVVVFKPRRPEAPVDPEQAMQAAVELHRIGRQLDVAYTKSEQRRNSSRLRREIGDALDEHEP